MWRSPPSLGSALAIRGVGSVPKVYVLLMLGAPGLDTVLQVGFHKSRLEGQNQLPHPPGHAAFDAALGMVGSVQSFCHSGYRNIKLKGLSKLIPFN